VFALAVRYLGNEEDAGDVLQETFIRVWKHIDNFDFRCKFTTWLYRIVINLCNDRARSHKRHIKNLLPDSVEKLHEHLSEGPGPEENNIKDNLFAVIAALAGQLTPKQQAVFVLRDLQDLSIAEVTDILGISKGAVKSNLSVARKNIRKKLVVLENNRRVNK
ncbi:MAG: RNA polymerase sigma factor, partial [bacterium]|nr:RNA polymerase sigma factor [bacterium]